MLLIRLPFLNQAIQGDDHIYLTEAQHALIDPLHPDNVKYVFLGDEVDLRGHSHPPGNAWPLAGLLLLFGDVKEVPFHAAYIVFSLIAVWAMWSLARRFSEHPVWATLLFIAVPAFVVNGGRWRPTCRSWPSGWRRSRCFCRGRLLLAALAMAVAAMMAYQAVFLIPILAVLTRWLCRPARRPGRAGSRCFTPAARSSSPGRSSRASPPATMPAGKLAELLLHLRAPGDPAQTAERADALHP